MNPTRQTLILLPVLATVAAGGGTPSPAGAGSRTAADSVNHFAFDLYGQLCARPGNLFISPYSIASALAMTYGGAAGQTAEQMAGVLHLAGPADQSHAAMEALLQQINPAGEQRPYTLISANALWLQRGVEFRKEYLTLVEQRYDAGLYSVDFAGAPARAAEEINTWASDQTQGRIKDILDPQTLSEAVRMVLTNAIYFKGSWTVPFDKTLTKPQPFTVRGGRKVETPFMNRQTKFLYGETDTFQLLELPYKGNELSMIVLLPRTNEGLFALETKLRWEALSGRLEQLTYREVNVSLPRFTTEARFSLTETLRTLGMHDAFSPGSADFSGMNGKHDLFISDVLHKTFVEVNEEGTEAAAVTAVVVGVTALAEPEPVVQFCADHPFLFLIRHRPSGCVLFLGRFEMPRN